MLAIPEWAIGVAFIVLAVSVAKALAGRGPLGEALRGRRGSTRDLAQALDDVQRRLTALEDVQRRLGEGGDVEARLNEVEERLDFAERLLAKHRDAERLDSPKH